MSKRPNSRSTDTALNSSAGQSAQATKTKPTPYPKQKLAPGWQQHSVRGFLAGVVRKKLRLKLSSEKVDGNRTYRIVGSGSARSKSGQPSRRKA